MPGLAGNGEIIVDRDDWVDELPSPRADTVAVPEHTGIRVKASAGPIKGELDVSAGGTGRSHAAAAVAFLIVAAAAALSAVGMSVVCWFAHAPSPLMATAGLGGFIGVLATGLILAFRRDRQPAAWPPMAVQNSRAAIASAQNGRRRNGGSRRNRSS